MIDAQLLEDTASELFEEAPCGYITTQLDGTIVKVNRTFENWTGLRRDGLLERTRFQDLLSAGGKIYYETHYAPLLQMQGWVREIAVEIVRADGSRLPTLVNSVLHRDEAGRPRAIRTTVFDATDRRRYEQELVRGREREREVALSLQRSLLAGSLPRSPLFELEVLYAPAGRQVEVGGDWYDAFWLGDGKAIGLVMGDVVGRGLIAATTMGHLRSAVRALASVGLGPAELLEALDTYSRRYGVGAMTTVAYGELCAERGIFRFACAGHPPPIVHEPGSAPRVVWGGRSLPINAYPEPLAREQSELKLKPGTTVLLYTDGLTEHRGRPADEGREQLVRLLATRRQQPLGAVIESIADALFHPGAADDRSLLGVRLAT
jgi:sigma-B regulation protein RsbU (phosphoserine phosphatase)